MTSNPYKGVGTALVTPFTKTGEVDHEALKRLVKRQLDGGVDMLVPCGTTGEAVTLSLSEYEDVLRTVVEAVDKRIPVVAGAGSNSTDRTIKYARAAQSCGVDALLIVGPYYNKPTQEGFVRHYRAVADAVDLPIIIYNVPGRTGSNMTAETQLRIAELDSVVATKEASGDLGQVMEIIRNKDVSFHVLSGDDSLTLPLIALGGNGVISVIANEIPDEFCEMVRAAMEGYWNEARRIHYKLLDLMNANFLESNPIPVKTALAKMGLITDAVRLPLTSMRQENREKLRAVLTQLDLLP
ncbi:MAG: 4-hydroxy-tetrahydrodipicolinate synthase [Chlorobi bacterium]|nr:4-hydroxy-tetrahydrodipicolinate synthase [Chlorobiota bacterium]